jgi:hypothetical protein
MNDRLLLELKKINYADSNFWYIQHNLKLIWNNFFKVLKVVLCDQEIS